MIGHLRGRLIESEPDSLLLDVSGIGYRVRVPLSTYYEIQRLPQEAEVSLRIHTHVREDALELFGFWTVEEQQLFERLIAVSGIGPKLAQVILSGMSPPDLLDALGAGDVTRLVRIPGVGKKTAERMVLELREAARKILSESGAEPAPLPPDTADDVVQALVNLGYRAPQAESAVTATRKELPDGEFAEILRSSLKRLSRA